MFNDDDRVALVAQPVNHFQQQINVMEMQARGRLVENVERAAGVALGEFERQFDALRFAARQCGRALAQTDIAEADIKQGLQFACNQRHWFEEHMRIFDRHAQHFGDVLALVLHLQRFAVIAFAMADVARHIHVRQEVHLDLDYTIALTRFAAAALDVEREAAS